MKEQAPQAQAGSNCRVWLIAKEHIADYWSDVFPLLAKPLAYTYDGMLLSDVRHRLMEDKMQLWLVVKDEKLLAACCTELLEPFGKKIARHTLAGGTDMKEWLDTYIDTIEEWARAEGCQAIEVVGRPGWKRFGKSRGYQHAYSVLNKEFGHG